MTGLQKRLARSNARYAAVPRMDLIKVYQRGSGVIPLSVLAEQKPRFPKGPPSTEGPPGRALSVWVRLLKAHSLILREVRRGLGDDPTMPQFDVLAQLSGEPAGLTLSDLSRRLLVSAGNLTGIVARLERDGLVSRREDPRDGRAFRIRLTPDGRARVRELIPRHARLLEHLLATLSDRELGKLQELLGRIEEDLLLNAPSSAGAPGGVRGGQRSVAWPLRPSRRRSVIEAPGGERNRSGSCPRPWSGENDPGRSRS